MTVIARPRPGDQHRGDRGVAGAVTGPQAGRDQGPAQDAHQREAARGGRQHHEHRNCLPHHGHPDRVALRPPRCHDWHHHESANPAFPGWSGRPPAGGWAAQGGAISALALADLLGRWPAADGPLYRLLAARIARLADTGELPAGLRLPPERDLAAALSVSRNTVAAAYQLLRDEGMAESRQGAGTRIVPHRTTPAAVHRANGFFSGLLESSVLEADLSLAAVDCAPQVAAALADPATVLGDAGPNGTCAVTATSGYFPLGLPALRAAIAAHLTDRLGLPAGPAEIIVTTGAQQALDLLIRCEVLPGQPVAVEDPTFPGALDALYRAGARVIGLPAGPAWTRTGWSTCSARTTRPWCT